MDLKHYNLLADIFKYPTEGFKEHIRILSSKIKNLYQDTLTQINEFSWYTEKLNIHQLEEYYINTFLIQPVTSMDIGFILFGDDQKRNDFLVKIQREQNKVQNECGIELADHLPNILTLIPKITSDEFRLELSYCLLIPAVEEIVKKFMSKDNFYIYAFYVLLYVLKKDFNNSNLDQYVIKKKSNTANLIKNKCFQ